MNKIKYFLLILLCLGVNILGFSQTQRDTTYTIKSIPFNTEREFQVHLPKKIESNEYLPIIFVFDAQWDSYYNLVISTIDYLVEVRELPKSIVVGINSEKRQYELTPTPVNEDWKVPNLGGAKYLEEHLVSEVIPFLEQKYKVANFRMGIGHSLGGTFVINSLIDNQELFNVYIAISPNLELDDEEIILKIQRNLSNIENLNKLFFVTMGNSGNPDNQFLTPVKKLDSILKTHNNDNFKWSFRVLNDYNHATTPLASLQEALLFISKKWKMTPVKIEKIIKSEDVLMEFKAFYKDLSQWTGYIINPKIYDYFNFIRVLEANQQYQDAIILYKDAIKNYPSQSRFYNGVAENLMKIGNTIEAEKYLNMALKVLDKETFEYSNDKIYFKNLYLKNLDKVNNN